MTKRLFGVVGLMLVAVLPQLACADQAGQNQMPQQAAESSTDADLLVRYLQEHFDDLHDVAMRFHHMDHTLGGLIVFETSWEDGVLSSIEVASNETNNAELPAALIEKFRAWRIEGMQGTLETNLPIRIQLVGSDNPQFPSKALITGSVTDAEGQPLHRALLQFSPRDPGVQSVPDARTNREGIFVRTLFPPGEWTLTCSYEGKAPVVVEGIALQSGEHHREAIVMN